MKPFFLVRYNASEVLVRHETDRFTATIVRKGLHLRRTRCNPFVNPDSGFWSVPETYAGFSFRFLNEKEDEGLTTILTCRCVLKARSILDNL